MPSWGTWRAGSATSSATPTSVAGYGTSPQFSSYRFPYLRPGTGAAPGIRGAGLAGRGAGACCAASTVARPLLKSMPGAVSLRHGPAARSTPLRGHWLRRDAVEGILRADGWFIRSLAQDGEPLDQWLWAGKRGVLALGVRLGRQRDAVSPWTSVPGRSRCETPRCRTWCARTPHTMPGSKRPTGTAWPRSSSLRRGRRTTACTWSSTGTSAASWSSARSGGAGCSARSASETSPRPRACGGPDRHRGSRTKRVARSRAIPWRSRSRAAPHRRTALHGVVSNTR